MDSVDLYARPEGKSTSGCAWGFRCPSKRRWEKGPSAQDVAVRLLDKRCKRGAHRAAFVAEKEVVKVRARWWASELKSQVEASRSSAAEGAEAAIPARVADKCNRVRSCRKRKMWRI